MIEALLSVCLAAASVAGSDEMPAAWKTYLHECVKTHTTREHIDFVEYYKSQGYQINPMAFHPVFVTPQMQWAVPSNPDWGAMGPPVGPMGPYGYYGPPH
jgi:hypothetical protein